MARIGTGGRFTKGAGLTAWAGLQEKGRFRAGLSINHPAGWYWGFEHGCFSHNMYVLGLLFFVPASIVQRPRPPETEVVIVGLFPRELRLGPTVLCVCVSVR